MRYVDVQLLSCVLAGVFLEAAYTITKGLPVHTRLWTWLLSLLVGNLIFFAPEIWTWYTLWRGGFCPKHLVAKNKPFVNRKGYCSVCLSERDARKIDRALRRRQRREDRQTRREMRAAAVARRLRLD
jgi:hypothetical protein